MQEIPLTMIRRKPRKEENGDAGDPGSPSSPLNRLSSEDTVYLKEKPLAPISKGGKRSQSPSFLKMGLLVVIVSSFWYISSLVSPIISEKLSKAITEEVRRNLLQEKLRGSITSGKGNGSSPKLLAPGKSASEAMKDQPSFWVDSERKLKAELIELVERQRQGLDQGVKVLTRYLGEDVPAWASKEEEEEWMELVNKKKAEMWQEEMKERNKRKEVSENGSDPDVNYANAAVAQDKDDQIGDGGKDEESVVGRDEKEQKDDNRARKDIGTFASPMDAAKPVGDDSKEVVVLLEPVIGQHRPSKDAVFAFAEGYDLSIYLCFVESLRATGFDGDIVLSVSALENLKEGVEEYLRSVKNIVLYTVEWTCIDGEGNKSHETKEGIRHCEMDGFYGLSDINKPDEQPQSVPDPREPRPVATARYELYWLWATKYESHSWIMLIDSRDTYFQLDPFQNVDRENQKDRTDGALHFFGEHGDVANLGESYYNRAWLTKAYGLDAVSQYFGEAAICSGSTMGEQIAIESYLRAMVAEFDETKCKAKGCDQGFHNYLYYSHKLDSAVSIRSIEAHSQGRGIINNVGAMRTKPLAEWGVFDTDTEKVLNWDHNPSPVVHQFDRDEGLNKVIKARKKDFKEKWKKQQSKG